MNNSEPVSRFHQSQRLRLHYADWGNAGAPPLVLVHGGADHCRTWDAVAMRLRDRFHVIAPDLRGHGDSDWATGSSYSLADYVHDLHGLLRETGIARTILIGHSMGGMVSLMFAGTFPEKIARLIVLDGMTLSPDRHAKPIHERMRDWIAQLDAIAARPEHGYASVAEAAARMRARNSRLSEEQALHLARHGTRRGANGRLAWKFDRNQQARAPYRLSLDDHAALWARIACPTLLLRGDESFLPDPQANGSLAHFKHAQARAIAGAAHWLHHDKLDEVMAEIDAFLA